MDNIDLIDKVRENIKKNKVVKDMFNEYEVDISEIDLIPVCFADLDVSARTDHGIIYLSKTLLDEDDPIEQAIDHYLVHEICHFLQQTTGTRPTKGAESGDYLDNEEEIEGFNIQTEFLADTRDESVAEEYVEQVLEHHRLKGDEKEDKRDELLYKD